MRLQFCDACERGDHRHHRRTVHAVSEGMMGGVVCDCTGECRDPEGIKRRRDKFLRRVFGPGRRR